MFCLFGAETKKLRSPILSTPRSSISAFVVIKRSICKNSSSLGVEVTELSTNKQHSFAVAECAVIVAASPLCMGRNRGSAAFSILRSPSHEVARIYPARISAADATRALLGALSLHVSTGTLAMRARFIWHPLYCLSGRQEFPCRLDLGVSMCISNLPTRPIYRTSPSSCL